MPTITSVTPSSGSTFGGTFVSIEGTDFQSGAVIDFGGSSASNVWIAGDGLSATCDTPSHSPGTVDVTLTNPDTSYATAPDAFTFTAASSSSSSSNSSSSSSSSSSNPPSSSSSSSSSGSMSSSSSSGSTSSSSCSSSSAVSVSFNSDPIRSGYSLLAGASAVRKRVVAAVNPANQVNNVTIAVKAGTPGSGRVVIQDVSVINPTEGEIEFYVAGVSTAGPTPTSAPMGDTTVEALVGGNVVGEAQVLVVIPKTFQRTRGALSFDNSNNPLATPEVASTDAHEDTTFAFFDQFGAQLDAAYNASNVVQESFSNSSGIFAFYPQNTWILVNQPDAVLQDGEKLDRFGIISSLGHSPPFSVGQTNGWENFNLVPVLDPAHPYNNVIAIRRSMGDPGVPVHSETLQKIRVHGHDVELDSGGTKYSGSKVEFDITAEDWDVANQSGVLVITIGPP